MLIATFGPATAWNGRQITYDGAGFALQDHGRVLPADVLAYERAGQLAWASDAAHEMVATAASVPAPPAPVAERVGIADIHKAHVPVGLAVVLIVVLVIVVIVGIVWAWTQAHNAIGVMPWPLAWPL